jgi:hypothetical protein
VKISNRHTILKTWCPIWCTVKAIYLGILEKFVTSEQGTCLPTEVQTVIWSRNAYHLPRLLQFEIFVNKWTFADHKWPARSKAWAVFARSNTGIMGSNPTRGMDVYVCLFCVFVVLCVGSGLATGWSPGQQVLPTVYRTKTVNFSIAETPVDGHLGPKQVVKERSDRNGYRVYEIILCITGLRNWRAAEVQRAVEPEGEKEYVHLPVSFFSVGPT